MPAFVVLAKTFLVLKEVFRWLAEPGDKGAEFLQLLKGGEGHRYPVDNLD